jgi:hypothetical protein
MNTRKLLLTTVTASLTLLAASCHDDDGNGDPGNATTVSELAADEIAGRTNETVEPIDLNTLVLSLADTDETASPVPVN